METSWRDLHSFKAFNLPTLYKCSSNNGKHRLFIEDGTSLCTTHCLTESYIISLLGALHSLFHSCSSNSSLLFWCFCLYLCYFGFLLSVFDGFGFDGSPLFSPNKVFPSDLNHVLLPRFYFVLVTDFVILCQLCVYLKMDQCSQIKQNIGHVHTAVEYSRQSCIWLLNTVLFTHSTDSIIYGSDNCIL